MLIVARLPTCGFQQISKTNISCFGLTRVEERAHVGEELLGIVGADAGVDHRAVVVHLQRAPAQQQHECNALGSVREGRKTGNLGVSPREYYNEANH